METVLEGVGPVRPGVTPPSQPGGRSGFLSDVLVDIGLVDKQTADWAVEEGRVHGRAVDQVLIGAGVLSDDQLSRATAELHGLDHVDLGDFDVDLDVARLISKSAAHRYQAIPIAFDVDGTLLVALFDPVDPLAVDDIAVMTKSDVHPMIATKSSIDAVIEQLEDVTQPAGQPQIPDAVPEIQSVHVRPEAEAEAEAEPPAPAQPVRARAPAPAENEEMAQMRQALADLAARVESFTALPEQPAAAPEPSVSVEEHDGVLNRLAKAEQRASEADGALDRLADAERRAGEADDMAERLANAERLAKESEAALSQLQGERDQEQLRNEHTVGELRAQLESAREANRALEQRLSSVLEVTAEIRSACEKVIAGAQPRT